jgi:hypothetical protein
MKKIALIAGIGTSYKDYRGLALAHFQKTELAVDNLQAKLKEDKWDITPLFEKDCTKQNILSQLKNNLALAQNEQDVELLFYFRGHGGRTRGRGVQSDDSGRNRYDEYLITWESGLLSSSYISDKNATTHFLTDNELTSLVIDSLPHVKRYFVILDCCYAGGMIDMQMPDDSPLVLVAASTELETAKAYEGGITFFTAALTDVIEKGDPKDLATLRSKTEARLKNHYSAAPKPYFQIPLDSLNSPSF